jgi:hypothetical protein
VFFYFPVAIGHNLIHQMDLMRLPTCLAVAILSEWSEVRDLANLDSAYCNYASRPAFLMTLRSPELYVLHTGSDVGYEDTTGWLKWHTRRGVKPSVIELAGNVTDVPLAVIAHFSGTVCGDRVASLIFSGITSNACPMFCMMGVSCKSVTTVYVRGCKDLSGLDVLISHCSSTLQTITFEHSTLNIADMDFEKALAVRSLKVVNCKGSVHSVLQCCVRLTEAIFIRAPLADCCLGVLEAHADGLTRLELEDVEDVSGPALQGLGRCCRNLHSLSLTIPPDNEVVVTFIQTATRLQALALRGRITDAALHAVAMHCDGRLRHLAVLIAEDLALSAGLTALATRCTALESLSCYYEEDDTLDSYILHLTVAQKGLLSIDFRNQDITDVLLIAVAVNCPLLEEVLLFKTTGYTAAGLVRLIDGCKRLQRVQVFREDSLITELVRAMWVRANPRLVFEYVDLPHARWRYDVY